MSNKQVRRIGMLAAAIGMMVGAPAIAAVVTNWNYSTNATFQSGTFNSGSGTTSAVVGGSELSWGATGGNFQIDTGNSDTNRSALTIGKNATNLRTGGGPVTGNIFTGFDSTPTGLEIGAGVTFTHWNNPISGNFATLTGGSVRDTLTLFPLLPNPPYGSGSVNAPTVDFDFHFAETPNGGPCAGGTATPCADLFGIVGFGNFNQSFVYDGTTYFASIFVLGPNGAPSPVATLLPAECAAINLAAGCQGFRTQEAAQTTAQFAFAITTERFDIPEPSSLALVGLALAGLGFAARRRSA